MFCAVYCLDKPDTAALRDKHLTVHRAYLDTAQPIIFFSGPLQNDDASASLGSLYSSESRAVLKRRISSLTSRSTGPGSSRGS